MMTVSKQRDLRIQFARKFVAEYAQHHYDIALARYGGRPRQVNDAQVENYLRNFQDDTETHVCDLSAGEFATEFVEWWQ